MFFDGKEFKNKDELYLYIKEKFKNEYNIDIDKINNEDLTRRKKHTKDDHSGPRHAHLRFMFPFKLELQSGSTQMILGKLVDIGGHPLRRNIVDFKISDLSLGNLTFAPAISFGDGTFFTTFKAQSKGEGTLVITAYGTDLHREIPIKVY
jgi:hypothetical protein